MPKAPKIVEETKPTITVGAEIKKPTIFREVYPIKEPYVYAAIVKDPETQKILYEIVEPTLQKEEEKLLKEIKSIFNG